MPRRPRTPLPRIKRNSSVSSWSSAWWAVNSTSPGARMVLERAIPRVARGRLEAVIGHAADRHTHGLKRHSEVGSHGGALSGPGGRVGVEPVIDVGSTQACVETEARERRQQHRRIDAATERDEETRQCLGRQPMLDRRA